MSSIAAKDDLDSQKRTLSYSRIQPWVVCFSAALFFFFIFIQLNMFNAIGPGLMETFHVDATVLASISDKYFLANILFLFPAGMLLDRISTRKLISLGMIVSIICTFAFAMAGSVWQMELSRFVTGLAGAFCLLGSVRLASRWFLPKKMALIIGLMVTFAMMGGMVAQKPLASLMTHYGWRNALMMDASFGVFLLFLIIIFVRDHPPGASQQTEHHVLRGRQFWRALGTTLCKRQNWFGGLYTSLMNLPIFLLGAIWGIFYLTEVQHLSYNTASMITSLLFAGMIIGSPIVGWYSDTICRRKPPMIIGAVFSLVLILVLMFEPNLSAFALGLLFFGIGFMSSAQIISYPLIAESNSSMVTATAEGMASVLIMAGGYTQIFFADLIQVYWNHQSVHGHPLYSLKDYQLGLSIMPVGFAISLVIAFFIRETYCKPYKETNGHLGQRAQYE